MDKKNTSLKSTNNIVTPVYYSDALVECACGAKFTIGSTVKKMTVEICSACHPFFTGTQKLVDTAGQVDKFKARLAKAYKMHHSVKHKKQPTSQTKISKTQNKVSSSKKKEIKDEGKNA